MRLSGLQPLYKFLPEKPPLDEGRSVQVTRQSLRKLRERLCTDHPRGPTSSAWRPYVFCMAALRLLHGGPTSSTSRPHVFYIAALRLLHGGPTSSTSRPYVFCMAALRLLHRGPTSSISLPQSPCQVPPGQTHQRQARKLTRSRRDRQRRLQASLVSHLRLFETARRYRTMLRRARPAPWMSSEMASGWTELGRAAGGEASRASP